MGLGLVMHLDWCSICGSSRVRVRVRVRVNVRGEVSVSVRVGHAPGLV